MDVQMYELTHSFYSLIVIVKLGQACEIVVSLNESAEKPAHFYTITLQIVLEI